LDLIYHIPTTSGHGKYSFTLHHFRFFAVN
jgi:hypothetical protein